MAYSPGSELTSVAQRYNKNGFPIASKNERLPSKDAWQVILGSSPLDEDYSPEVPKAPEAPKPPKSPVHIPQSIPSSTKLTPDERGRCAEAVVISRSTYGRKVYLHCLTMARQPVLHYGIDLSIPSDTRLTVVCKTWKVEDGVIPEEGDTILFRVWSMTKDDQGMDVPKNSSFVQVVSRGSEQ
jgi:hypothetical protein